MAVKIIIPGADFSGLGNPKVEDYIEGLPGTGLAALYLFERGTVGQDYAGPATDYSGNLRHAPLLPSSVAKKTPEGVGSAVAGDTASRSLGFGIMTPVAIGQRFTVFGVSRNTMPSSSPASGAAQFLMPWASSGNFQAPTAPTLTDNQRGAYSGPTGTKRSTLGLNQQNAVGGNETLEIGLYNRQATEVTTPWASQSGVRPAVSTAASPKASWLAWAVSFDRTTGVTMRTLGGSVVIASPADADAFFTTHTAVGARHLFGAMSYQSSSTIGEMAAAGVYDGVAKTVPEMDVVLAAIRKRVASRGIVAA